MTTQYKPDFAILSEPRTGSSLLLELLRNRNDVVDFGECFNYHARLKKSLDLWPDVTTMEATYREMFDKAEKWNKLWGFKNHFSTSFDDTQRISTKDVDNLYMGWHKHLHPNTKIIRVFRHNLVRQYVSFKIAQVTDQWFLASHDKTKYCSPNVEIDTVELFDLTNRWAKYKTVAAQLYPNSLALEYEEFTQDINKTWYIMQNYLNIWPVNANFISSKMNSRPLKEIIINYDEVKREVKGTKLEEYLCD